jgi:hypothetical protein
VDLCGHLGIVLTSAGATMTPVQSLAVRFSAAEIGCHNRIAVAELTD